MNYNVGDLQLWWIPQVPMNPFTVDVDTVEEAVKILQVLAHYDLFQLDNNIKPDYSNAGGLCIWCEDDGSGKPGWQDWYDDETGLDDPIIWLAEQREQMTKEPI